MKRRRSMAWLCLLGAQSAIGQERLVKPTPVRIEVVQLEVFAQVEAERIDTRVILHFYNPWRQPLGLDLNAALPPQQMMVSLALLDGSGRRHQAPELKVLGDGRRVARIDTGTGRASLHPASTLVLDYQPSQGVLALSLRDMSATSHLRLHLELSETLRPSQDGMAQYQAPLQWTLADPVELHFLAEFAQPLKPGDLRGLGALSTGVVSEGPQEPTRLYLHDAAFLAAAQPQMRWKHGAGR